jgi:hypothetical protein
MNILLLSVIAFLVLQVFDVDSTKKVLANGGRELNPIINFFMKKLGVDHGLYFSKLIVVSFILGLYSIDLIDVVAMTIVNIVYLIVIINNYRISKK